MKNRLLRALGIGAALAMPIAGFAALGSGTAGAVANGLYNSMWQFTFSAAGGVTTVLCTTVTLQITTEHSTNVTSQYLCTVKPTGGHYGGIGTATTIHLLIMDSSTTYALLFKTSETKLLLMGPQFSIKVKFGLTVCTIYFTPTIQLTRTHGNHTKYSVAGVGLNGHTIVSPTTGVCGTITHLLNTTPTSRFGAALTL